MGPEDRAAAGPSERRPRDPAGGPVVSKTGSVRRERTERAPREDSEDRPRPAGPAPGESERRPRDRAAAEPSAPPAAPVGPSGARIALAFAASFLLSFPVLLAVFHFATKEGAPARPAAPAAREGGGDSLWDAPKRETARPRPGSGDDAEPPGPRPDARVDEILARARDRASAKNYVEALSDLTYLLKTAGGDPRVRTEIERVEAARRVDVRAHLDEASRRIERGDLVGARRKVEVVLWWSPGDREAEALLARIDRTGR